MHNCSKKRHCLGEAPAVAATSGSGLSMRAQQYHRRELGHPNTQVTSMVASGRASIPQGGCGAPLFQLHKEQRGDSPQSPCDALAAIAAAGHTRCLGTGLDRNPLPRRPKQKLAGHIYFPGLSLAHMARPTLASEPASWHQLCSSRSNGHHDKAAPKTTHSPCRGSRPRACSNTLPLISVDH
jgi:hypothetical protein